MQYHPSQVLRSGASQDLAKALTRRRLLPARSRTPKAHGNHTRASICHYRCQVVYLKPGFFVRKVFNPIAAATGINGAQFVTAIGRTSGKPRAIPAMPVDVAGETYLVSVYGESDWVLNLRANPSVTVSAKGVKRRFVAGEVPVAERDPIIAAYRDAASKTIEPYWQKLPNPIDHPVFRLTPA